MLTSLDDWLRALPESLQPVLEDVSVASVKHGLAQGLSGAAGATLERLANAGDRAASIVLAEHHASVDDFGAAAARLRAASVEPLEPGDAMLLAHCLTRVGDREAAQREIDALRTPTGPISDGLLACANLALPDGKAYLSWINQIYRRAGLSELETTFGGAPRLGTWTAAAPAGVDDENRISVLMPVFNAERLLAIALDSLLAQSWRNLEVIVIDDCSADGTVEIAMNYARRDPRVIVLRQERNGGAYRARNAGLARATGRLVTVHDADDWSHPQKLEIQARHMLGSGVPIVASAAVRVLEDMTIRFRAPQRTHLWISFPSHMFDRQVVQDVGGWDCVRMGADAELYSRLSTMFGVERIVTLPDVPLSFMLSSPQSLTGRPFTGIESGGYGARRQYIEAYRHWHASLEGAPLERFRIDADARPFPAPNICFENGAAVSCDDAFVFDFMTMDVKTIIAAITRSRAAGRKVVLVHWPRFAPPIIVRMNAKVKSAIADMSLQVVVPGESLTAERVVFQDESLVRVRPDSLPDIRAGAFLYLCEVAPPRVHSEVRSEARRPPRSALIAALRRLLIRVLRPRGAT